MPKRSPAPIGPGFGNGDSSRSVLDYINQIDELNKYGVVPEIYPKTEQEAVAGEVLKNYTPQQKSLMDYINYFAAQENINPSSFKTKFAPIKSDNPNYFISGIQNPFTHEITIDPSYSGTDPKSVWNAFHEFQHEAETQKGLDRKDTGGKINTEEKFHHGQYERPIQDVWPYLRRRREREELGFPNDSVPTQMRGPASLQEMMTGARKAQLLQAPWFGRILPGVANEQNSSELELDYDPDDKSLWTQEELNRERESQNLWRPEDEGLPSEEDYKRANQGGFKIFPRFEPNETMIREEGWNPSELSYEELSKLPPEQKKAYEKQRRSFLHRNALEYFGQ